MSKWKVMDESTATVVSVEAASPDEAIARAGAELGYDPDETCRDGEPETAADGGCVYRWVASGPARRLLVTCG